MAGPRHEGPALPDQDPAGPGRVRRWDDAANLGVIEPRERGEPLAAQANRRVGRELGRREPAESCMEVKSLGRQEEVLTDSDRCELGAG